MIEERFVYPDRGSRGTIERTRKVKFRFRIANCSANVVEPDSYGKKRAGPVVRLVGRLIRNKFLRTDDSAAEAPCRIPRNRRVTAQRVFGVSDGSGD
jgi:hypothetical protein